MIDPPIERLFFALRPSPDAVAAIGRARVEAGLTGKPIADDRLHVTLFLFEDRPVLPLALVEAARAAAATIAAPPFRLVFDRLVAGRNALLAPSEPVRGLDGFQARLTGALADAGLEPRKDWRFRPHVTLGYGHRARFETAIDPIGWVAGSFVLIRSLVGLTRHETLESWRLC